MKTETKFPMLLKAHGLVPITAREQLLCEAVDACLQEMRDSIERAKPPVEQRYPGDGG